MTNPWEAFIIIWLLGILPAFIVVGIIGGKNMKGEQYYLGAIIALLWIWGLGAATMWGIGLGLMKLGQKLSR